MKRVAVLMERRKRGEMETRVLSPEGRRRAERTEEREVAIPEEKEAFDFEMCNVSGLNQTGS